MSSILVTGATGFVGSRLIPRLLTDGHDVRAFSRDPTRVRVPVTTVRGDVLTGAGLEQALDGVEIAYYLIHSMEPGEGDFAARDRTAASHFAAAARAAGVRAVVYLGGPVPAGEERALSAHLRSRLEVERELLTAAPESTALRASIVIGSGSRSFRFIVRLVERLRIVPLPAWRSNRSAPVDERDVVQALARAPHLPAAAGRSLDLAGPETLAYGALIERVRDLMLLPRPALPLCRANATPLASRVAATVAGEDHALVGPLMDSLQTDLLPRPDALATPMLNLHLHRLDAAIEHALREWETVERLAAR